jgi:hypothetical protein
MVRNLTVSNNAVEFRRSERGGAGRSDNDHIEMAHKNKNVSGNTTDRIVWSMRAATNLHHYSSYSPGLQQLVIG